MRETEELVNSLLLWALAPTPQTVMPPDFLDSLPSVVVTATSYSSCEPLPFPIWAPLAFACLADAANDLLDCFSDKLVKFHGRLLLSVLSETLLMLCSQVEQPFRRGLNLLLSDPWS